MKQNPHIAVVGATGLVGRKVLEILLDFGYQPESIDCFASRKSKNKIIKINKSKFKVKALEENSDFTYDVAIFSAGKAVSKEYAPEFAKQNCFVVDNSNAFRRDENVPLVVGEINMHKINLSQKIIANPNCSTIQLALPLFAISKIYKIKRVVVSTYQAVSGAGKNALNDLKFKRKKNFEKVIHQIYNNLIPHIDVFLQNGDTLEEDKVIFETKKILDMPDLSLTATCVRVPVENCHSESVNVEFDSEFDIQKIIPALSSAKGIKYYDNPNENVYPMPIVCNDLDDIFVGRLRRDNSIENALNFWSTADNLRKGAALNAVQISDYIIKEIL